MLERSLEQMLSRPAFVQRIYLRRGENDLVVQVSLAEIAALGETFAGLS